MTLANSKFAIIPFCFDSFKIRFFVYDVTFVTAQCMVKILSI